MISCKKVVNSGSAVKLAGLGTSTFSCPSTLGCPLVVVTVVKADALALLMTVVVVEVAEVVLLVVLVLLVPMVVVVRNLLVVLLRGVVEVVVALAFCLIHIWLPSACPCFTLFSTSLLRSMV